MARGRRRLVCAVCLAERKHLGACRSCGAAREKVFTPPAGGYPAIPIGDEAHDDELAERRMYGDGYEDPERSDREADRAEDLWLRGPS